MTTDWIERYSFKTRVTIPYGKLMKVFKWCNANCENDWIYDDCNQVAEEYTFYFESEYDYVNFLLWCK